NSQKMIVVGKNGARIKSIGSVARCELEKLLERRVHLFLHVKVRRDWSERPDHYRTIGLNFNA
ncbi:MAG: KH domain-containing protein, partial [Alphaproteobacteria bacterium]